MLRWVLKEVLGFLTEVNIRLLCQHGSGSASGGGAELNGMLGLVSMVLRNCQGQRIPELHAVLGRHGQ